MERILIRGARTHNLKNVDVELPRDKLIVITGLSGSGKSSLAFDTIYAEGQRRYVESLSAYARQFVEQLPKPDIDSLTGLPPTVAIEQRVTRGSAKSTVATVTEVAQYLRVLFARAGVLHSPTTGEPLEEMTEDAVVRLVAKQAKSLKKGSLLIAAPLAAVAVLRLVSKLSLRRDAFVLLLAAFFIGGLGTVLRTPTPWHDTLHAKTLTEFFPYFARCLAWPLPQHAWLAPLVWLPWLTLLFLRLRSALPVSPSPRLPLSPSPPLSVSPSSPTPPCPSTAARSSPPR